MQIPKSASTLQAMLVLAALGAAPAAAQDPTAQARALFNQGVACVARHDWACAEQRFRAALELRDAPAVRYNLASAVYEQGRFPEASSLTRQVLADPEAPAAIHQHATELRETLGEEGALARVVVTGAPEDAELRVDGYAVRREDWAEVAVAPGERVFALFSGERQLSEVRVTAEAGRPLSVALTVVATPEQAAASGGGGGGGGIDFDALLVDPLFWGIVGGSVALVIVVIVIVAVATSGDGGTFEGDFQPGVLRW